MIGRCILSEIRHSSSYPDSDRQARTRLDTGARTWKYVRNIRVFPPWTPMGAHSDNLDGEVELCDQKCIFPSPGATRAAGAPQSLIYGWPVAYHLCFNIGGTERVKDMFMDSY